MTCRGGSERGLGDGVVSCSRTPHDKAVVGGRAQVKLPRHPVLGMRVKLKEMSGRSMRAVEADPPVPPLRHELGEEEDN